MTFTTAPSPSKISRSFPDSLSHTKRFPSSEPETTNSSLGPRKFTRRKREDKND